jgi:hypothetical protein
MRRHFKHLRFKTFLMVSWKLNLVFFPFPTKALNIRTSCTSATPKVGAHLGIIRLHLPMVNPIFSILEKCKEINSKEHPTFITYPIITCTLSTITMQHKWLESFNYLPLKSHTKYVQFFSFFLSLSKEGFTYSHTTFSYHFFIFSQPLSHSPHTTYKAHIDP